MPMGFLQFHQRPQPRMIIQTEKLHPRLHDRLPCSAADTRGCPGRRRRRPDPAEPHLRARPGGPEHVPARDFAAGSGINFESQVPDEAPRREDLLRLDYQVTDKWRITGRYMNTKEEDPAGVRHHVGRERQRPAPDADAVPAPRQELPAHRVRHPQPHDVARGGFGRAENSLDYDLQLDSLAPRERRRRRAPSLFPSAIQADYVPFFRFRGGRTGNAGQYQTDRGPFTNETSPTTCWRTCRRSSARTRPSSACTTRAATSRRASTRPSTATSTSPTTRTTPSTPATATPTRSPGVFDTFTQADKFALPEWVYNNLEWYGQDNWKASRKLTLDYGVASALEPAVGPDAAGLEVPAGPVRRARRPRVSTRPSASARARAQARTAAAWTEPAQPDAHRRRHGRRAFHRPAGSGFHRFNGAYQAGQGIDETMQSGNSFKISPRFGFTYDVSGRSRRSCAAASGSSTTGRRAIRCST